MNIMYDEFDGGITDTDTCETYYYWFEIGCPIQPDDLWDSEYWVEMNVDGYHWYNPSTDQTGPHSCCGPLVPPLMGPEKPPIQGPFMDQFGNLEDIPF